MGWLEVINLKNIIYVAQLIGLLIAPVFTMGLLNWLLPIRKRWWAKGVLYFGCVILVNMIIYVGDRANLPGTMLCFFVTVLICCEGTWLQRFSLALIVFSIGVSFNTLVDSFIRGYANGYRLCLWIFIYFILRKFAPRQSYDLPLRLWVLLDILVLTPFAATIITVLLSDEDYVYNLRDVLLLSIVFFTSCGLFWALVTFAKQHQLEQEQAFYQVNQAYYKNLELEQIQIRRLRHDMANHLQVMAGLPTQEIKAYIHQLLNTPAMEHRRYCENHVVNAVLSVKMLRMEQSEIAAELSVALPEHLPVAEADLCAVFANALDNAIEACEKIPVPKRFIRVKAQAEKGLLVLRVLNSMDGLVKKTKTGFATTKADEKNHGFGLKGIREIVSRYEGSVEFQVEEKQFSMLLYIPLPPSPPPTSATNGER